ncbi:rho GDP-dissociation inhibitor 2-like [Manis pentadactyla]|uniref:rho GDP-dissociation inhibitor 2-like n=1 Tax=Manis pentadactyla TaxID=143292 RepID=UPI00255CF387|nr:rho GDP-dissociation inhibitor 2-like [Manis pentadactyla]
MDKDDDSLAKYKKMLLADGPMVADPSAPNVTVTRLTLVCESAPGPITMDLTGDLEALIKETFVLKEGVEYRVKIYFKVNRDIVSGLKYVQHSYRTGVKVDKATFMVGSYGPWPEEYEFLTPAEEAPKGMLAGSSCHNKSFFTDDDKHDHLT